MKEHDLEVEQAARDKELEEESIQLENEIEQVIRGELRSFEFWIMYLRHVHKELSEEERTSILSAPEFLDFVEHSSKVVQRALNDGYDYIREYTTGAESGASVTSAISSTIY